MAHNINLNNQTGRHSFFSVQKKAWHNLGQVVQDYPTSAEAIRFAGLDFEVAKTPIFTRDSIPSWAATEIVEGIGLPDYFATLRTDTRQVFGIVGKDYQIVQNRDAFAFFDAIVGGGEGILYETAGALGQGERIFITAKLPGYIRVGSGDDVTEKFIFLTTSHDGTGSITAAFTPVRIVCQNTLNAALENMSNVVRLRHTAGVRQRLDDAHRVMGMADQLTTQLEGIFNQWAKQPVSDGEVETLIQYALCPNKETMNALNIGAIDDLSTMFTHTVEDALNYAMTAESQQMTTTKGTLFGAYNAVTGFFQNIYKFRDEESKLQSLMMGGTAHMKTQRAFELCQRFARHGTIG